MQNMNKFVMMYCNIWTGECWKALHQPELICTRLGRALSIHPGNKRTIKKDCYKFCAEIYCTVEQQLQHWCSSQPHAIQIATQWH